MTCRSSFIPTGIPKKNAGTTAYHDQCNIIQDCRKANCLLACLFSSNSSEEAECRKNQGAIKGFIMFGVNSSNQTWTHGNMTKGDITSPNTQRSCIPRITRPRLVETPPSSSFAPRPLPDLPCPKAPPSSALCRADSPRICRARI